MYLIMCFFFRSRVSCGEETTWKWWKISAVQNEKQKKIAVGSIRLWLAIVSPPVFNPQHNQKWASVGVHFFGIEPSERNAQPESDHIESKRDQTRAYLCVNDEKSGLQHYGSNLPSVHVNRFPAGDEAPLIPAPKFNQPPSHSLSLLQKINK